MEFRSMGYYGRKITEMESLARERWLITDIRINPFSRFQPEFIGKRMAAQLGEDYLHIPEWGNPQRKEGILAVADFGGGLQRVKATGREKILLFCACKYPAKCHRSLLGELLRQAGYDVEERAS